MLCIMWLQHLETSKHQNRDQLETQYHKKKLETLVLSIFPLISKICFLPGRSAQKETEHGANICPLECVYFCSMILSNISHFWLVQNPQTIPLDIETYY